MTGQTTQQIGTEVLRVARHGRALGIADLERTVR
jgi:hypothetical protein